MAKTNKELYATVAKTTKSQIDLFRSLELAQSWANRQEKIHLIVLGEVGEYVVCLPRYSERLVKAGYQYAA